MKIKSAGDTQVYVLNYIYAQRTCFKSSGEFWKHTFLRSHISQKLRAPAKEEVGYIFHIRTFRKLHAFSNESFERDQRKKK